MSRADYLSSELKVDLVRSRKLRLKKNKDSNLPEKIEVGARYLTFMLIASAFFYSFYSMTTS